MDDAFERLNKIRELVRRRRYRVRVHAVRHMIEEGFREKDIVDALASGSEIIEDYSNELRCLVLGYFSLGEKIRAPLHIVCDYSNEAVVDIVTAYVPEKPWWATPRKRGKAT